MAKVSLLLWDIGGVLLSNGWDSAGRTAAADHFHLDRADFERRHAEVEAAFETGEMDLAHYLDQTVFAEPRTFTREAFVAFMRSLSTAHGPALECARSLRAGGRFVLATLNNESAELNEYRITAFGLREIFHVFLSSCYTGHRKPDPATYRYALQLTQRAPAEALFLDDRSPNIEAADRLGLRTVWVRDPDRVQEDLARAGIGAG